VGKEKAYNQLNFDQLVLNFNFVKNFHYVELASLSYKYQRWCVFHSICTYHYWESPHYL